MVSLDSPLTLSAVARSTSLVWRVNGKTCSASVSLTPLADFEKNPNRKEVGLLSTN